MPTTPEKTASEIEEAEPPVEESEGEPETEGVEVMNELSPTAGIGEPESVEEEKSMPWSKETMPGTLVKMQRVILLERMEEPTRTSTRSRQRPDYLHDYDCSCIQFCRKTKKFKDLLERKGARNFMHHSDRLLRSSSNNVQSCKNFSSIL